jgi:hypothetical protein
MHKLSKTRVLEIENKLDATIQSIKVRRTITLDGVFTPQSIYHSSPSKDTKANNERLPSRSSILFIGKMIVLKKRSFMHTGETKITS